MQVIHSLFGLGIYHFEYVSFQTELVCFLLSNQCVYFSVMLSTFVIESVNYLHNFKSAWKVQCHYGTDICK